MLWRELCADVFDIQGCFGGDAVFGEEVIDGGAEELAVDEEFEGNRGRGVEESVAESGESVAAESWRVVVSIRVTSEADECRFSWLTTSAAVASSLIASQCYIVTGANHKEVFLLVETRIGPGFSGNSSAESLVLSWILTCVLVPAGAFVIVVVAMMFAAGYAALLLDSKLVLDFFSAVLKSRGVNSDSGIMH